MNQKNVALLIAGVCVFNGCAPSLINHPASAQSKSHNAAEGLVYLDKLPSMANKSEVLSRIHALYPTSLRREGVGGKVVLAISIAEDGTVSSATVTTSSGYPEMDRAALDVAKFTRWIPATTNGKPVKVRASFPVIFQVK